MRSVYLPANVEEIDSDNFHGLSKATFYVQKDSYAEQFLNDNGFEFEYYE